jgi:hypothetical protein
MAILKTLTYLIIYPGLLFIFFYSTFAEWYDRKLYASFRTGWDQPIPAGLASFSRSLILSN